MTWLLWGSVYLVIVAVIFGLVAVTNWRHRAATDGEGAFLRRLHDGVVVSVGVLFAAVLGAVLVPAMALMVLGATGVLGAAPDQLAALLVILGAALGAAYAGASHMPGGAVRGVGVVAFAALVGVGTWSSPLADPGAWRGAASVAASVVAAVVAAAGLFARPRDP